MNMKIDIKPCPFCGADVSGSEVALGMDATGITRIRVQCECGADIVFNSDNQPRVYDWNGRERRLGPSALDKWNRRAEDETE